MWPLDKATVNILIYLTDPLELLLEYYILSPFFSCSRKTIPGFTSVFLGYCLFLFLFFKYLTIAEEKKKRERETNSLLILPYETNNLARLWKPIKLLVKLFFYSQS